MIIQTYDYSTTPNTFTYVINVQSGNIVAFDYDYIRESTHSRHVKIIVDDTLFAQEIDLIIEDVLAEERANA